MDVLALKVKHLSPLRYHHSILMQFCELLALHLSFEIQIPAFHLNLNRFFPSYRRTRVRGSVSILDPSLFGDLIYHNT